MKNFSIILIVIGIANTLSGVTTWDNEAEAKKEAVSFVQCTKCKGKGYTQEIIKETVKSKDAAKVRRLGKPRTKNRISFSQCESCIQQKEKEDADKKKKEVDNALTNECKRLTLISSSLIGAIDCIEPVLASDGRYWVFGAAMPSKEKEYKWTPKLAALMPARCPIVFQVLSPTCVLVKSEIEGTISMVETLEPQECIDGEPFLVWGTYRYIGVKSYETILRAKKTIRYFRQVVPIKKELSNATVKKECFEAIENDVKGGKL